MVINGKSPGRRSIRLPRFDYSQMGAYFLTICSAQRKCIFGHVEHGQVVETALGQIIRACWLQIGTHFAAVETDVFVVMPNHLHGILIIRRPSLRITKPQVEAFSAPVAGSIPTIVRTFKAAATREARKYGYLSNGPIWQRDYYERVIRDAKEYAETWRYIASNPVQWESDENHPRVFGKQRPRLCQGARYIVPHA